MTDVWHRLGYVSEDTDRHGGRVDTLEALETQLRACPDDWSGWLVLADWLLEHGDPRGEVIALEHQLDTRILPTRQRHALSHRLRTLLQQHQEEWLAELSLPKGATPTWLHGFLVAVWIPWTDRLLEVIGTLHRGRTGRFLSTLDLTNTQIDDDRVTALSRSPALAGFRSLRLGGNQIHDRGAAALAASPHFEHLAALDLGQNRIGSAGAAALAKAASMRSLGSLDLGSNPIRIDGVASLAESELIRGLRSLRLGRAGIDVDGAELLASAGPWRLEELVLGGNAVGTRGARALARSRSMSGLRSIDLQNNGIDGEIVADLVRPDVLPGLNRIDLRWNRLGSQAADRLVDALARRGCRCVV